MIKDPPSLTIKKTIPRPSVEQLETLATASTGVLVDCLGGRGALCQTIKPINAQATAFYGVAITCDAGPADNLAVFGAMHIAKPGDVIMIATDAFMPTAVIGDLVLGMSKNSGVAAIVTDGCVRDIDGICKVGLPCFAAGVTPNSPARVGPGTVGLAVNIGGVQVNSGDVIVGDKDGVVVVPLSRVPDVLEKLQSVLDAEAELDSSVAAGLTMPDFVQGVLADRVRWVE